jgi:hypothetical protein
MPGYELFGSVERTTAATTVTEVPPSVSAHETNGDVPRDPMVYYNPRLDPKNFLEGPLSLNPATRLRQMLARPGIVVSPHFSIYKYLAPINPLSGRPGYL